MANNNVSITLTHSVPTFVPRVIMIATYTWQTQTPSITSTSSTVQTDTQTLHNNSTQTKLLEQSKLLHHKVPELFKQNTWWIILQGLTLLTVLLQQKYWMNWLSQPGQLTQIERERYITKTKLLTKEESRFSTRSTKLSSRTFGRWRTNNRYYPNTWDLWTTTWTCPNFSNFFPFFTYRCSVNSFSTLQPLAPPIQYHNKFLPMSSQQKAAMAHSALINFFGNSGTVSSILQMVQPTQPQVSTGQPQQLTYDLQVMVSDNQEGNLQTSTERSSTHNSQNIPYTIQHISHSRTTSTETNVTQSSTITQQEYNRESYRVPQYYSNSHSYSDRRVRRQNTQRQKTYQERWQTIKKPKGYLVCFLWTMSIDMYI